MYLIVLLEYITQNIVYHHRIYVPDLILSRVESDYGSGLTAPLDCLGIYDYGNGEGQHKHTIIKDIFIPPLVDLSQDD